jgi:DNA (cytosine-5)-methyltransferase 1
MKSATVDSSAQLDFGGVLFTHAEPQGRLALNLVLPDTVPLFIEEVRGNDHAFLRLRSNGWERQSCSCKEAVRIADLFCGAGGLTLGAIEGCIASGRKPVVVFAAESEKAYADCFEKNFRPRHMMRGDLAQTLAGPGSPLTANERALVKEIEGVELLLGGPPCQGHSDLNNFSRRKDPKNALYLLMVRAAEIFRPPHIVIENVATAVHDIQSVVQRATEMLSNMGYQISIGVLNCGSLGVAQLRRRLFVVASLKAKIALDHPSSWVGEIRDAAWAFGDLEHAERGLLTATAAVLPSTKRRIEFLFRERLHDLPDSQRPACHRDKKHSYKSIYGRMHWDKPAQTVTTGFYSMCMGRYIHPSQPRTINAWEAARLQFFPDYYDFSPATSRAILSQVIGNAVPSKISYCLSRTLLTMEKDIGK